VPLAAGWTKQAEAGECYLLTGGQLGQYVLPETIFIDVKNFHWPFEKNRHASRNRTVSL